eukprot:gnl/MRDRNA2_/MRDRNA2_86394_c0_seq1.p1 gnl/MRDRNA2_/MRDRNA2_86394_c0~~gnl/MRDRNA2_/MRDRNA2_86394_c0_seq1.p1  ORF type:complete len:106 (-),score=22.04 gnl/MRDRNA2_/MRDRNA2_86394_c0_seq1:149-466(-)
MFCSRLVAGLLTLAQACVLVSFSMKDGVLFRCRHTEDRNGDGKGIVNAHGEASKEGHNRSGQSSSKGVTQEGVKRYAKEPGATASDIRQVLRTCTARITELAKAH